MPGGTGDRNSPGRQEAAGEANGLSSRPEKPVWIRAPRAKPRTWNSCGQSAGPAEGGGSPLAKLCDEQVVGRAGVCL